MSLVTSASVGMSRAGVGADVGVGTGVGTGVTGGGTETGSVGVE